jgi:hypothetical protein
MTESEFYEIKNRAAKAYDGSGWRQAMGDVGKLCASVDVLREELGKVAKERDTSDFQIREALVGLELLERNCPCGARPESLDTHPHVTNCLVEAILRKLRGG